MFLRNLSIGFILFNLIMIIMIQQSHAEYRVYQYTIKSKEPYITDPKPYTITSTLDPVSYISYHGGKDAIQVDLVRTWMCKGHTGSENNRREICSSPYAQAEANGR